jgi:type I restriction enzyme S subunit
MKYLALGDIVEILDSKRRPISKKDRKHGPYPYYGATGIVDYIDGYIFDEELVLVGEDGAKWKSMDETAFIVKGKTWVNNHAHVLKPNNEIVLNQFLIYYLNFKDLSEFVKGITVPKLNQTNLKLIPIPVPSLQEQEKIVERLDEIFKNIQNNLDMLSYLNTLITTKLEKSIFISECEKVDTKKLKVKEFSNIQGGGTPKTSVKEYWGGEIDFYTPKELSQHSDIEISSSSKKVTKLGLSKGAGKLLPVDTILFSSRAPIGYVAILKKEGSTNQGFQSFILKNQNDKYFFYFLLRNNKEYIESYAPGATFKDISKSRIEEIEFAIPSYEQQIEIGKKMVKVKNNIEKKSKLYKSNYEDLLKLRKSILDKEFSYE